MKYWSVLWLFFLMHICFAQNERGVARDGNKNYNQGRFSESEIDYRKSLSKNKGFEEAQFNLADALFKQDRYDESMNVLNNLISETNNLNLKSEAYYNLGNNLLQKKQLENAVDAYKNCLRLNPSDEEARYNLSKAISLMQQQDNQDEDQKDQDEDQQDQNEDQQDQNSGETSSPDDEKQESDDKKQDSGDKKEESASSNNSEEQSQNSQQSINDSKEELSREEIERILDALEREEQRVQGEMQKKKQKNKQKLLEKDW